MKQVKTGIFILSVVIIFHVAISGIFTIMDTKQALIVEANAAKIKADADWMKLIREKYSAGLDGKPLVWGRRIKRSMKYKTIVKGELNEN